MTNLRTILENPPKKYYNHQDGIGIYEEIDYDTWLSQLRSAMKKIVGEEILNGGTESEPGIDGIDYRLGFNECIRQIHARIEELCK